MCEIYRTEIDAGTRAKRIKAEYGQGGASWPLDGLGLHGYDTFHGSGLRIQWKMCIRDRDWTDYETGRSGIKLYYSTV